MQNFLKAKAEKRKLSMVTCYDYTFARLLSQSPVDAVLVGDSAAMVIHGHRSTVPATVDLMRLHTEAVARGAGGKLVIADMPFLSYRKGVAEALNTAHSFMSAGAQAVKLEGVEGHEDVIERMVQSGIPVMGHVGLQPQSVNSYGGFRVQGRNAEAARAISEAARKLETLGAFAVVLECIPASLAEEITASLKVPTIGIGAGPGCDGQVLVLQDLLGMNLDFKPKFVRHFSETGRCIIGTVAQFDEAVKSGEFPGSAESYE
jgi:3-methyl-2-oxobutanoate hydroxymethyltransferase